MIKYVIDVKWVPLEESYRSVLKIGLPCIPGQWELDPMFRSPKSLAGKELYSLWGNRDEGFRWADEMIGAYPTSADATREARNRASEVVAFMREIVDKNRNGFNHEQRIEEEIVF